MSDVDAVVPQVADWETVVRRARTARMGRTLRVALLLSHDLLDTTLPAEVLALARGDEQAVEIARMAADRLPDAWVVQTEFDPMPWFLSFQERPIDRARFHARRLIYEWFLKWPWDEWLGRRSSLVRSTQV